MMKDLLLFIKRINIQLILVRIKMFKSQSFLRSRLKEENKLKKIEKIYL